MLTIYLADFNHRYQKHVTFPYPVGLIASYARRELGSDVSIELFKDFEDFRESFRIRKPDIAGFTNYMWNSRLSYKVLELVKSESPETIGVMGGANYPDDVEAQREFLHKHPAIDFYIFREGELAFASLVKRLMAARMSASRIRQDGELIESVHYLHEGEILRGPMLSRIKNLDEIPSPYLTGVLDRFFEQDLSVLIQRTRGCPFACTFCTEGMAYFNKVNTFTTGRFEEELSYCASRLHSKPGRRSLLHIADANFGMFLEDLEVGKRIGEIRKKWGWPHKIEVPTGKNKKERVIAVMNSMNAGGDRIVRLTASVQSTDLQVLEHIKRDNISAASLINAAKEKSGRDELLAYGEVILALPGDSFTAHTKTIKDLVDEGIQKISHQYLTILPGTEMDTRESREKFAVRTAFRIMPGAYGKYRWNEKEVPWFETEERAIANNTMTFDEYLRCLEFDLTVETFFNDTLFDEYFGLLRHLGLPGSKFLDAVFDGRDAFPPGIDQVYRALVQGRTAELEENEETLVRGAERNPRLVEELIQHENRIALGNAKAALVFGQSEGIHKVAYEAMAAVLRDAGKYEGYFPAYLREAHLNSLARKSDLLEDRPVTQTLHYDFTRLHAAMYAACPGDFHEPQGIEISYDPNPAILKKHTYLRTVEPDQVLRWRKLLFEPRVDTNDEFCRLMRKTEAAEPAGRLISAAAI